MKRTKNQEKNLFYRSFEIDRAQVDEKKRSVQVAFSSETPIKRYYGDEYLLHDKSNVDLKRLKTMGSALFNHDPDIIVGSVKNIKIGTDRIGRAEIVFDDDDDGNKALRKVQSGSLKGISVGYRIEKMREIANNEEYVFSDGRKITGPAMLALKWMPYEISLTPIPADASVGVGRSLDGIEIEKSEQNKEQNKMNEKEIREMIAAGLKAGLPDIISAVKDAVVEENKLKMRIDLETYQNLLGRAGAHSIELKAKVADMAIEGKTEREIVNAILDTATPRSDAADKGNGAGENGTGIDAAQQTTGTASFKNMTDDDFFRGLSSPGLMAIH